MPKRKSFPSLLSCFQGCLPPSSPTCTLTPGTNAPQNYFQFDIPPKTKKNSVITMNASFEVADHYPNIYRMPMDKPSELLKLYSDILGETTVSDIKNKLAAYVVERIEPVDWKAIWRSTMKSTGLDFQCDFEVEIVDVTHNTLEAIVIVRRLLSPVATDMTTSQFDDVEHLMKTKVITVPLTELYVISEGDPEQQFSETAIVIEHVRFFYKHLWRAWDGVTGPRSPANDVFVESRLQSRINLYSDIKNKLIPEATVNKIRNLLEESWKIRDQLDEMSNASELIPENESSGDNFLDEADVYEGMRLRVRLEDIDREMRMLEDPYLRTVASTMSCRYKDDDVDASVPDGQRKCHVLAKKFTSKELEMITNKLKGADDEDIQITFHSSLDKTLQQCRAGDRVFVLPGLYICDSLPWIEHDIELTGLTGNRDDAILQASDSVGDIFLNCSANAVLISNLTFRTSAETHCIVMAHTGMTNIVNCVLDGGKCARNSIVSLSKAEVALDGCKILHEAANSGILQSPKSNVTINGKGGINDFMELSDEDNASHSATSPSP